MLGNVIFNRHCLKNDDSTIKKNGRHPKLVYTMREIENDVIEQKRWIESMMLNECMKFKDVEI